MLLKKLLVILSSLLVISGCSSIPTKTLVTKTEYVEKQIPIQDRPEPLKLNTVTWSVVTQENLEIFLSKQTEPVVFYAISVKEYEALSINLAEIARYIKQQKAIILYYEKAVQPTKGEQDDSRKQDDSGGPK